MKVFVDLPERLSALTRFTGGSRQEAEELFGSNLQLPEGQVVGGEELLVVELHSGLKRTAREVIASFYDTLTGKGPAEPLRLGRADPYGRYFQLLAEVLTNIIQGERRQGLLNLFWLAHSKEVAEVMADFFAPPAPKPYVKYQMHPLLSGLYRGVLTSVWQKFKSLMPEVLQYNLGSDFNTALIDSIIDDQLPLTELHPSQLNLGEVLVEQNKRFHISFKEFTAIFSILRERLREGIRRKEEPLLSLIRRTFPTILPDRYEDEKVLTKFASNSRIHNYLLLDYGELASKLLNNPVLKAEVGKGRGWLDLLSGYQDLVQALKRAELIGLLRGLIKLTAPGLDDAELKRQFVEGKLYRFRGSPEILNIARKVTILFADLRGFTKTSEGGISEGELTSALYQVFDPLTSIVKRYGGKIDKFTGDGAMVLFGATRLSQEDELNALRTALAIQKAIEELRKAGRTRFQMGISVHTGRVNIAHFIADERRMDTTVIGRNVNIAGRLSASGGKTKEKKEEGGSPEGVIGEQGVWVDEDGVLYNAGIAVSQDTVDELSKAVALEPLDGKVGYRFYDEALKKNILLEYVGDVKFKGIGRAIPIYQASVEA